jgi:DNA end-binding protein Ku
VDHVIDTSDWWIASFPCMASSVWKGYLTFGLVSFPIRLTAAARPETVHFHMLHAKDESRIKEVWYCADEDKPVKREDIVKGYEYEKGRYVVVQDDELKKVAPPTARTMDILQFVKAAEVDPVFLEKSYYVIPEETVSKPYWLLLKAMSDTKYYAIAKVSMHAREHIVVIRPTGDGMVLHTMYYVNELRKANQATGPANEKFNQKEMDLAKRLIETLASRFKPEEYHDQYRENIEHLIEQKLKGGKITPVKQPKVAPVVNILEALQRSLGQTSKAAKGKTAQSQSAAKKQTRKRARKAA